ncbi:MAG: hypothetical protein DELT_03257 [Desulfovibrio sp.]
MGRRIVAGVRIPAVRPGIQVPVHGGRDHNPFSKLGRALEHHGGNNAAHCFVEQEIFPPHGRNMKARAARHFIDLVRIQPGGVDNIFRAVFFAARRNFKHAVLSA